MPLGQDVRVCLPPALVSRFLGECEQLLAVVPPDSVELQEPRDLGRLESAARQLISADFGL